MKIACVGWGSLIWRPETLPLASGWFEDGPLLPVEFARHSSRDRVTLVLVSTLPVVQTLWCLLATHDLSVARDELAKREGVVKSRDRNTASWSLTGSSDRPCADAIGGWAIQHQLDAVVWTSLRPKWKGQEGRVPSAEEVLDFIRAQGQASEAAEYIRKAPAQIDTDYRRRMRGEIEWLQ